MADRGFRGVAANLLTLWTDSDTAMEVVGTSLGVFGEHGLDPVAVLSKDTALRDALFDILLSLVEGGALEMRPLEDGRYAFRWRADIATAGLVEETRTTIDIAPPPADLEAIAQLRAERDEALRREAEALGRAEFAEALAAEQKRLLLAAEAPVHREPPGRSQRASREPRPGRVATRAASDVVAPDVAVALADDVAVALADDVVVDITTDPPPAPAPPVPASQAVGGATELDQSPPAEVAPKPKAKTRRRSKRVAPPLLPPLPDVREVIQAAEARQAARGSRRAASAAESPADHSG